MRIASLQPSVSLTLAALGRLDDLCACTRYCLEALPELAGRNLPILHDSWSFGAQPHDLNPNDPRSDAAGLLAAKPDLLVSSVPYRLETLAAILRSGHPVLALAPHTLANIFADIRLLASVIHATPEADTLIASFEATLHGTRTYTATASTQPLVYCEEWGKPLIRSQTWVAELVAAANGQFLGTPGAHTTPDEVAAADPDVLVFAWCGAGNRVPLERSSPSATGSTSAPSKTTASTSSPTSSSTPPLPPSSRASPASPAPSTPTSTRPTPTSSPSPKASPPATLGGSTVPLPRPPKPLQLIVFSAAASIPPKFNSLTRSYALSGIISRNDPIANASVRRT